ncbi:hypothetical protein V8C35DRAFT_277581 [Trichoderma chlorosporum]
MSAASSADSVITVPDDIPAGGDQQPLNCIACVYLPIDLTDVACLQQQEKYMRLMKGYTGLNRINLAEILLVDEQTQTGIVLPATQTTICSAVTEPMDIMLPEEDSMRNMLHFMLETQQLDMNDKVIMRQDALERVRGIIRQAQLLEFDDKMNKKLEMLLMEQMIKVLPPEMKIWVSTWAQFSGRQKHKKWVDELPEDRQLYTWINITSIAGQPRWSSTGPAETLVADLELLSKVEKWTATEQRKLVTLAAQFKHYTRHFEPMAITRAKAEAQNEVKGLSTAMLRTKSVMSKCFGTMEEKTSQTNQAMAKMADEVTEKVVHAMEDRFINKLRKRVRFEDDDSSVYVSRATQTDNLEEMLDMEDGSNLEGLYGMDNDLQDE